MYGPVRRMRSTFFGIRRCFDTTNSEVSAGLFKLIDLAILFISSLYYVI